MARYAEYTPESQSNRLTPFWMGAGAVVALIGWGLWAVRPHAPRP